MTEREQLIQSLEERTRDYTRYKQEQINYITSLFDLFVNNRLLEPGFLNKLTGDENTFHQAAWEMIVAQKFIASGYTLHRTTSFSGPDFYTFANDRKIWIEAIAITSGTGRNAAPTEFPMGEAHSIPHNRYLQRWTSGIEEKRRKLEAYLHANIVAENEAYIIAINGALLNYHGYYHPLTGLPYALHAVFPIGLIEIPYTVPQDSAENVRFEQARNAYQPIIHNQNNSPISTDNFLNPRYRNISAIYSSNQSYHCPDFQQPISSHLIHNHLAANPVSFNLLGCVENCSLEHEENDEYSWKIDFT